MKIVVRKRKCSIESFPESGIYSIVPILGEGGAEMPEVYVGKVSDFYSHPVVASIDLRAALQVGDRIKIKGHTTDMECLIESMQINHLFVNRAGIGDSVGIKVPGRVRKGDAVYKEFAA